MKVNTKLLLSVVIAIIIVVGVLVALLAWPQPTQQQTTITQTQSPIEKIVIRFSGWGAGETEVKNYEKAISDFSKKYPNIVVKYEPIAQMYHENILASFAGGAAPDVFYVDSSWAQTFIDLGVLKAIDDIVQDPAKLSALKAQYYDFLLKPFIGSDGKLYGLPKDWSVLFLAYNKQCLASAGLSSVPDNWNDFFRALEYVTDKTGKPALVDHYHWRTFVVIALSYGAPYPDFSSENSVRAWFSNDAVKKALKDYMDLYLNGYVKRVEAGKTPYVVLPRDVDSGWGGEAFGKQQACFTFEGSWMIPFIKDQFPNFKYGDQWDITLIPKGPAGRYTLAFTVILGINSKTQHPKEAFEFVNYVAGVEGQKLLVVSLGHTLPSIKELASSPDLWPEHRKSLELLNNYGNVFVWPTMNSTKAGAVISSIDNIIQSYIARMKDTKTYDFDQLLNDLINSVISAIKS